MKIRKKILPILLSTSFVALTACGGDTGTTEGNTNNDQSSEVSSSEENITLNVWHQWPNDSTGQKTVYDNAVEEYMNEHPNVTINTETLDTDAYKTKMVAEFTGDAKGIDVFFYWGPGLSKRLADAGKLLPLNDYLTDDIKSNIQDGALESFDYDGQIYSLPSYSWFMTLFCNGAIFEEAGAPLPNTYDELVEAVEKINTLDNVIPLASGAATGWNAAFIYEALALREVGAENVNSMLSGEMNFDDPGYMEAAEKIVTLNEMGAFGNNPLEDTSDSADTKFYNGTAAMRLGGSWFANTMFSQPEGTVTINPDDVVALKIPMISGKGNESDYAGAFTDSFYANNNTENPDVAADFCIYINEKVGVGSYEIGAGFSGWKTEADESQLNPIFKQIQELTLESKLGMPAWDTALEAEPATIVNEQSQVLFSYDVDLENFDEVMQSALNTN